jgi:L-ascorbate metabolism protein UlaG (beta-lactamase superfamily)
MKAIFHGHAFLELKIDSDGKEYTVLIDPFIEGNSHNDLNASNLKCDYIILTHAHGDHYGSTEEIAKNNDATVIANHEISEYLDKKGIKVHGMNPGGAHRFPFGKVKFTIAHHSSSFDFEDGAYAGNPVGVIVSSGGKVLYDAGDTALFYDMKLIGEMHKIDVAFLPIGDNYTMGIDDAVKAAEFLDADTIVPMHYNTFEVIEVEPEEFKKKIESIGKKCSILQSGEAIEI